MIDPHIAPAGFSKGAHGEVVVEVHQIVRDLRGKVIVDQMVGHIFQIKNEFMKWFDIRGA